MAYETRTLTNINSAIATFTATDREHRPSWKNSGGGFAELNITSHRKNPYLSFHSTEVADTGHKRETYINLDPENAGHLYAFLKSIYEPEATDDPA